MNVNEIKARLTTVMDQMLSDGQEVTYMQMVDGFIAITDETELLNLGADALADYLRRVARSILNRKRRTSSRQMAFEGLGEFSETVTTINAEGAYVVKLMRYARAADLMVFEKIHRDNADNAREAWDNVRQLSATFLPVMEENDCTFEEAARLLGFEL